MLTFVTVAPAIPPQHQHRRHRWTGSILLHQPALHEVRPHFCAHCLKKVQLQAPLFGRKQYVVHWFLTVRQ